MFGLAFVAAARAEPTHGAPSTALGKDLMTIMDSFLSGVSHSTLMDRVHKKSTESGGRTPNNPLSFYVMPFLEWALEHNVSFDSLDDAIHGLEVGVWEVLAWFAMNPSRRLFSSEIARRSPGMEIYPSPMTTVREFSSCVGRSVSQTPSCYPRAPR